MAREPEMKSFWGKTQKRLIDIKYRQKKDNSYLYVHDEEGADGSDDLHVCRNLRITTTPAFDIDLKITFFIQLFQQKANSCLLMLPSWVRQRFVSK